MLSIDVGRAETEAFWREFLQGLVKRGLTGVQLVGLDSSLLDAALDLVRDVRGMKPTVLLPDLGKALQTGVTRERCVERLLGMTGGSALRGFAATSGFCGLQPGCRHVVWTAISPIPPTRKRRFAGLFSWSVPDRTGDLRLARLYSAFRAEPG